MAIREILEVPDPRLKIVSTPVEPHEFNADLRALVEDMFETMYDAPGIGLAAIQVGVPKRVLVIDLQPDDPMPSRWSAAMTGTSTPIRPRRTTRASSSTR
jgi:peptide deformylase